MPVQGLSSVLDVVTLGSLVGAFWDRVTQWRLRNYVEGLIDGNRRFSDDERTRIKRALGITGGDGFGFRLKYTAFRGFVTSDQNQARARRPTSSCGTTTRTRQRGST